MRRESVLVCNFECTEPFNALEMVHRLNSFTSASQAEILKWVILKPVEKKEPTTPNHLHE